MALPWIIGAAAVAAVGAIAKAISDDNEREREKERESEIKRLEKKEKDAKEKAEEAARKEAERREEAKKQEKRNFAKEQLNVLLNDFSIAKSTISFDSVVNGIIDNKQEDIQKYFQDKLRKKHENNGQLARIDELSQKRNELNSLLGKLGG